jgi:predicted Ser/Thr protein kinase
MSDTSQSSESPALDSTVIKQPLETSQEKTIANAPSTLVSGAAATSPSAVAQLKQLGPYMIKRTLGKGGMGVVFEAEDPRMKRSVALKVMIAGQAASEEDSQRFRIEIESAAKLQHPNIIGVHDVGRAGNLDYFTMEYVEGDTLTKWLREKQRPYKDRALMVEKVCRAIHHAHERKILHRDIKPSNIIVDSAGEPHVMDFGLARNIESGSGFTLSGAALGTPQYMPPEQAEGRHKTAGPGSDIWSLGAVLYEALTGKPPFTGESIYEILIGVTYHDPIAPRKLTPTVPPDLETICLKCLEKKIERRYATAAQMADDLKAWRNGEAISAHPLSRPERLIRACKRRPAVAVGVVLGSVMLLAGSWLVWSNLKAQAAMERAQRQAAEARELERIKRDDEDKHTAEFQTAEGKKLLSQAQEYWAGGQHHKADLAYMAAEDRFRKALFAVDEFVDARKGMLDTALLAHDIAMKEKHWGLAAEKLILAEEMGLAKAECEKLEKKLHEAENAHLDYIKKRVKEILSEAETAQSEAFHTMGRQELITLADEETTTELLPVLQSGSQMAKRITIEALAWMDDARVVPALLPMIQRKTPGGEPIPPILQATAIRSLCIQAPLDGGAMKAIEARLAAEPGGKESALGKETVEFVERYAKKLQQK